MTEQLMMMPPFCCVNASASTFTVIVLGNALPRINSPFFILYSFCCCFRCCRSSFFFSPALTAKRAGRDWMSRTLSRLRVPSTASERASGRGQTGGFWPDSKKASLPGAVWRFWVGVFTWVGARTKIWVWEITGGDEGAGMLRFHYVWVCVRLMLAA